MKTFLTTLILLLIGATAIANTHEEEEASSAIRTSNFEMSDTSSHNQLDKIDMYKLLYENSASANERIISTMHWAIGIVATFILAIFGSQIFFNYRINKEEIGSIRSDIDEKFISLKSDVVGDIYSITRDNERATREELMRVATEGLDAISEKQKGLEKYLDAKIESLNKENQTLKENVMLDIKDIKVDLGRMSGYVWDLKGVKANALGQCIETAIMQIDLGRDPKYTLRDLAEILNESDSINKAFAENLEELISKIPENHDSLKQEIEKAYKAKRVYVFVDDPDRPGYSKVEYI
ncbi:hypothetical protein [Halomonas sp. CSM-2]|uniref:hypothetical protein n=1 Tax=Halomonas sp. CSM-2 TaxID=1975722 RepID=UPI00111C0D88|nr:hypothetical protein [Halomonas sp. CSM-2]